MTDPVRTAIDLDAVAASGKASLYPDKLKLLVGSASCGLAAGAADVEAAALAVIGELEIDADVTRTGCIGFCDREPIVDLRLPDGPRLSFEKMTAGKVKKLLESYAAGKSFSPKHTLCRFQSEEHVEAGEVHSYPLSANGFNAVREWKIGRAHV